MEKEGDKSKHKVFTGQLAKLLLVQTGVLPREAVGLGCPEKPKTAKEKGTSPSTNGDGFSK